MAVRAERVAPGWRNGTIMRWLTTVDHKRIGLLYIGGAFLFFVAAGIMALIMRTQLAAPEQDVLTKDGYNGVLTMHGTAMVFLFAMPFSRASPTTSSRS